MVSLRTERASGSKGSSVTIPGFLKSPEPWVPDPWPGVCTIMNIPVADAEVERVMIIESLPGAYVKAMVKFEKWAGIWVGRPVKMGDERTWQWSPEIYPEPT